MLEDEDADAALFAAVWTFHRAMGEVFDPLLASVGITNAQFFLLFFIGKIPSPTVGGIAGRLGVRMSTVTHLINDLEGRGLVRRERSTEDRRVVRLLTTARGSRLLSRVERLALDRIRTASTDILNPRKADAARLLNEVAARLLGTQGLHRGGRASKAKGTSTPSRNHGSRRARG